MKFLSLARVLLLIMLISPFTGITQEKSDKNKPANPLDELSLSALNFREIGPALTSGRISDIAVNPKRNQEYYVATSSGGVWKTSNNGTTYKPIFDNQGSYSIGCVTIDPNNHNVIWVGTGENNNQRSVAYGDGVYKSVDGGNSWTHMGLKNSEHIGKIIVHPDDSNVVYVAAIGPLWSRGGDRGLYKSTDGGETWKATLEIDKYTGVTDMVMDPVNPDIIYAAAFQRARHTFTYLGGGPGSGMYKSVDGGDNWTKANKGLPSVEMGRIGLAVTPADPEIIYAIVEAAQGKSGFYKSTNRGASWSKQSSKVTSGNYYQEIIADPVNPDRIYTMDTWMQVSHDGGKSFKNVGEDFKHVDNHSLWINPENNTHLLVGCDGGIYESWDLGKTWSFKANLPVTQFYKVALDNEEPFYNVYGGTQDNFSLGGPSRTQTAHGITNRDWFITHGGDGFESQIDPENPDIVYAQSQYGVLVRYDRKNGEEVGIQPKERKDELAYRWNWDAPLIASPHASGRLYFAANKVFRSDDYGNSWEVISEDLTKQINRNELKIMDKVWSIDAVAKNRSTSPYGTIVAMSESTLDPNLIIVGTDDGNVQVTNNGGKTWSTSRSIPGAPSNAYVNAVFASHHDANVVYLALNHHKYGDFKPYIYKSVDQGKSWKSINSNLPDRGSVYAIEEDHVDPNLIFCGTEFGVFFSSNQGSNWKQLKAGVPTVAVRDLAIQKRENDLVLGTFGRGFYVLDDYSALRNLGNGSIVGDAKLFPTRTALAYEQSKPLGLPGKAFQGDAYYTGENLDPVAMLTYYYGKNHETLEDGRKEKEKENTKNKRGNTYPSYDELKAEGEELPTNLLFTIKDDSGKIVRKIFKKPGKGIQRIHWDLRYASKEPVSLGGSGFYNPFASVPKGNLVAPGSYTVEMGIMENGSYTKLAEPETVMVKALNNAAIPNTDKEGTVVFQREVHELSRSISGAGNMMSELGNKLKHIREAIKLVEQPYADLSNDYNMIDRKMKDIRTRLYGDSYKSKLDIDQIPSPATRVGWISYEQGSSTSAPTKTHMESLAIAKEEFAPILSDLKDLIKNDLYNLEKKLEEADAPYTPGRSIQLLFEK